MRVVIQRVRWAKVTVDGRVVGEIESGLAVLLGVGRGDGDDEVALLSRKLVDLRIFSDENDKMNRSLLDVGGGCLVVSQFTLYADVRRGRRPFFGDAEDPARAREVCDAFAQALRQHGVARVATGEFGAMMQVELCNDGPVTIVLDSAELRGARRPDD